MTGGLRPAGRRLRPAARAACALAAAAVALAAAGCGNADPSHPIPHNTLESLVVNPWPVYWLGGTFHGLAVTEASEDPSGSLSVQYGNCLEGGQGTCVPPLLVTTSADNSFVPGGGTASRARTVRGVTAQVAQQGRTILIATGPVVVGIYASTADLARAAAQRIVPINQPGSPGDTLPAASPDSGYGSTPLPGQEPQPLRPVR